MPGRIHHDAEKDAAYIELVDGAHDANHHHIAYNMDWEDERIGVMHFDADHRLEGVLILQAHRFMPTEVLTEVNRRRAARTAPPPPEPEPEPKPKPAPLTPEQIELTRMELRAAGLQKMWLEERASDAFVARVNEMVAEDGGDDGPIIIGMAQLARFLLDKLKEHGAVEPMELLRRYEAAHEEVLREHDGGGPESG